MNDGWDDVGLLDDRPALEGWSKWVRILSASDRARLAEAVDAPGADPERLLARLTDPARIRAVLLDLTEAERRVLLSTWAAGRLLSIERSAPWGEEERSAVQTLGERGLLVQITYDFYQQVYACPAEARPLVRTLVVRPVLEQVAAPARGPKAIDLPANPVWLTDLFRLLSHVRWFGAPLTQQGMMYKRWERAVEALLWPEHAWSREERVALLLRFARFARLLDVNPLGTELQATTDAPAFFRTAPAQRWRTWWRFFEHELYRLPLGPVVVDAVQALPAGTQISTAALAGVLEAAHVATRGQASHQLTQLVRTGIWLGFFAGSAAGFRLSDAGRAYVEGRFASEPAPHAIMEPTGELMVPVETPLGQLWDAEEVLSLKRADMVWTYHADTAAGERAHDHDLSADAVIDRITGLLATPMPENIAADIRDRLRRHLGLRVIEGTLVTARDAATLQELKRAIGPLVAEQISDRVLVAAPGSGPKILARLRKAGVTTKVNAEVPGRDTVQGGLLAPPEAMVPYQPRERVALPGTDMEQVVQLVLRSGLGSGRQLRLRLAAGEGPAGPRSAATVVIILHQLEPKSLRGLRTDVSPPQWITVPLSMVERAELL